MSAKAFSFIGSGDVYIDVLTDAGVPTGLQLKGNCTKLAIKPASETKEQIGRGRTNYGQVIATAIMPKPASLEMTLDQVDAELFAMALSGSSSALNQTAGTVTDQQVTALKGKWVELGKFNISNVVVTDSTGATTYARGTDYNVNPRLGLLEILDSGAITNNQSLKVDYSYAATTGLSIAGMTRASLYATIKLDGKNYVDGRNFVLSVWRAKVSPNKEVDFLASKFIEVDLSGTLETPVDKTEPFQLVIID